MTDRDPTEATAQSIAEELANTVTHGVGAVLSIAGLVAMVAMALASPNPWSVAAVTVFGLSLVLLYIVSALYHGIEHGRAKRILKFLDHSTIFILIAGTYTPLALLALSGGPDWFLLTTIWGLALIGIVLQVAAAGRFEWLRIALYVAMGWLVIAWAEPVISSIGWSGSILLLIGGIAYTGGLAFYAWDRLPFNHSIWHLFVLTGSMSHFGVVMFFVI